MTEAARLAGWALEHALNSADTATVQIHVAEMFITLGTNFLRAVQGEERARQFLQSGIDQLDHPTVVNVIRVEDTEPETKH